MATAAHVVQFYLKASSGSVSGSDEVDGVLKSSISINGEQLDTTDFKDTTAWHTFIQGLKGAEIKFEGHVEPADSPQNLVRSSLLTYADLWCTYLRTPSASTGAKGFKAQVMVESYEESPEVAGVVPFSASLRVTGAVAVDS